MPATSTAAGARVLVCLPLISNPTFLLIVYETEQYGGFSDRLMKPPVIKPSAR